MKKLIPLILFLISHIAYSQQVFVVANANTKVYDRYSSIDTLGYVMEGDSVPIVGRRGELYKIIYKGDTGYSYNYYFDKSPALTAYLKRLYKTQDSLYKVEAQRRQAMIEQAEKERVLNEKIEQERKKAELAKKDHQRKTNLINKYGEETGLKLYNKKVWIGMNQNLLIESWGRPSRVNKTITSSGTREQWVYYNDYVYVENGKVSAIQTSR